MATSSSSTTSTPGYGQDEPELFFVAVAYHASDEEEGGVTHASAVTGQKGRTAAARSHEASDANCIQHEKGYSEICRLEAAVERASERDGIGELCGRRRA